MNAAIHAKLSLKSIKDSDGDDFEFFHDLHSFMDISKEIEPSNLHRCLTHHLHFVRRVVIPIHGHTYKSLSGSEVNIKDDMERNHLIADFRGKFMPSISDYAELIDCPIVIDEILKRNESLFDDCPQIKEHLLSPLHITGRREALWLTCNSWYMGEIIPKVYGVDLEFNERLYAPSIFFSTMKFPSWIQNGMGPDLPTSYKKIQDRREAKSPSPGESVLKPFLEAGDKEIKHSVFYDGSFLKPSDFKTTN